MTKPKIEKDSMETIKKEFKEFIDDSHLVSSMRDHDGWEDDYINEVDKLWSFIKQVLSSQEKRLIGEMKEKIKADNPYFVNALWDLQQTKPSIWKVRQFLLKRFLSLLDSSVKEGKK